MLELSIEALSPQIVRKAIPWRLRKFSSQPFEALNVSDAYPNCSADCLAFSCRIGPEITDQVSSKTLL